MIAPILDLKHLLYFESESLSFSFQYRFSLTYYHSFSDDSNFPSTLNEWWVTTRVLAIPVQPQSRDCDQLLMLQLMTGCDRYLQHSLLTSLQSWQEGSQVTRVSPTMHLPLVSLYLNHASLMHSLTSSLNLHCTSSLAQLCTSSTTLIAPPSCTLPNPDCTFHAPLSYPCNTSHAPLHTPSPTCTDPPLQFSHTLPLLAEATCLPAGWRLAAFCQLPPDFGHEKPVGSCLA